MPVQSLASVTRIKKVKQIKLYITRDSHRGNPFLTLKYNPEDKWGFSFGYQKAKILLAGLAGVSTPLTDTLAKFVADVEASRANTSNSVTFESV